MINKIKTCDVMMNVGGERAFNYNSIYNYSNSSLNFNDSDSNDYQKRNDDTQNVLYYIIVSVFYLFLFVLPPPGASPQLAVEEWL